jgi:hypothetical protein
MAVYGWSDRRNSAIVGQVLQHCAMGGRVGISVAQAPARRAGGIVIFTSDASTPQLTLESVPGVEQVAELLRKQVQIARKQTGVSYHDRL